jgi:hypothetical protein
MAIFKPQNNLDRQIKKSPAVINPPTKDPFFTPKVPNTQDPTKTRSGHKIGR